VYDSRRDVIGVVLSPEDKVNIASMLPTATVYSEFVRLGSGTEPGLREFSVECVVKLLERIKEKTADPRAAAGAVDWIDEGIERPMRGKPAEPIGNEREAVLMRWQEYARSSDIDRGADADVAIVTFVLRECRLAERAVRPPETKHGAAPCKGPTSNTPSRDL
jgi:hypothetical protein